MCGAILRWHNFQLFEVPLLILTRLNSGCLSHWDRVECCHLLDVLSTGSGIFSELNRRRTSRKWYFSAHFCLKFHQDCAEQHTHAAERDVFALQRYDSPMCQGSGRVLFPHCSEFPGFVDPFSSEPFIHCLSYESVLVNLANSPAAKIDWSDVAGTHWIPLGLRMALFTTGTMQWFLLGKEMGVSARSGQTIRYMTCRLTGTLSGPLQSD